MLDEALKTVQDLINKNPKVKSINFTNEAIIIHYNEDGESFIKPFEDGINVYKWLEE